MMIAAAGIGVGGGGGGGGALGGGNGNTIAVKGVENIAGGVAPAGDVAPAGGGVKRSAVAVRSRRKHSTLLTVVPLELWLIIVCCNWHAIWLGLGTLSFHSNPVHLLFSMHRVSHDINDGACIAVIHSMEALLTPSAERQPP